MVLPCYIKTTQAAKLEQTYSHCQGEFFNFIFRVPPWPIQMAVNDLGWSPLAKSWYWEATTKTNTTCDKICLHPVQGPPWCIPEHGIDGLKGSWWQDTEPGSFLVDKCLMLPRSFGYPWHWLAVCDSLLVTSITRHLVVAMEAVA